MAYFAAYFLSVFLFDRTTERSAAISALYFPMPPWKFSFLKIPWAIWGTPTMEIEISSFSTVHFLQSVHGIFDYQDYHGQI